MAQRLIFLGTNANDGSGESLRGGGGFINDNFTELYAVQSQTINAGAVDYDFTGATDEGRIQLAVNDAVLQGFTVVFIPAFMLPYDVTLVSLTAFNAINGRLIREGGNPDVYDVLAYGAASDGIIDDAAAQQAVFNAVPSSGGIVHYPSAVAVYLTGSTVTVPGDRLISVIGDGAFATNVGGLQSYGAMIRRQGGFTSGPLMAQSSATKGMQMTGMGFDGNNLAGDLLVLTDCTQARIKDTVFFNSNGNGLLCVNLINSRIAGCSFFELGNATAHPNGKSSLVLNTSGSGSTNTVLILDCYWENGRGSYLTSDDPSGTHPISLVSVIGGKMEWSGNITTGFEPAVGIGMPFIVPDNGISWVVDGLITTGGYHTAATHYLVQSCSYSRFDVHCSMPSGKADSQNPRFLFRLFSGSNNTVRGTFVNGASTSAGTGAQIQVVESSCTGYSIAPDCQFISPISGVGIVYTNPTTGKASRFPIAGAVQDKSLSLTGAASTAINANDGNYVPITIGSNIAVVAAIPTNPPPTGQSQELIVEFFNNSGGALSTAPTFATGTNGFLIPGTIVNPSNGTSVLYGFRWSPIRSKWIPMASPQATGL